MNRALPKGHLSCLSNAFRYTPAIRTSIAATFERIRRERASGEHRPEQSPGRPAGRFPLAAIDAAKRVLAAGGFQPAARAQAASR